MDNVGIKLQKNHAMHIGNMDSGHSNKKIRPWTKFPFYNPMNRDSTDIAEVKNNQEMLDDVIKRSQTVLLHTKSIFPFDFFPNDLIIDITKVTVVDRNFFLSGHIQSINIRDIFDVRVETGPFFSSITILDLGYIQRNKLHVRYLKKKDAKLARQIIEGLIAASKAGVDLTKIPRRDLISKMPELLQSQIMPTV